MVKRTISSSQRNPRRAFHWRGHVPGKRLNEHRPGFTSESFERFLCWLSPDRNEAGLKYEQMRKKLVTFFTWRGCHIPDELFDRTMDRVSRKLALEAARAADPFPFCYGVAKNILHEHWREPRLDPMPRDVASPSHGLHWDEDGLRWLEKCLGQLNASDRELITRYYQGEGREKIRMREEMALEVGGVNALRIRAHRIRASLREKVSEWRREQGRE